MEKSATIEFPPMQNDSFPEIQIGRISYLKDLIEEMSKIRKKKVTVEKFLAEFGFDLEEKEKIFNWISDTVQVNGQKEAIKKMTVFDFLDTYGKRISTIRSADDAKRRLLAMKDKMK